MNSIRKGFQLGKALQRNLWLSIPLLLLPLPVHAASDWGDCVDNGTATIQCLEPLFANTVQAAVSFVGIVLFFMLVYGGFKYLLSSGDQKKLEQAKQTLSAAVLGFIVIIAAYAIIRTVQVLTGVDTTHFTIPK